jgi:hypothetical protein
MALAGRGNVIPVDDDIVTVAKPFIGPWNIPPRPFLTRKIGQWAKVVTAAATVGMLAGLAIIDKQGGEKED